MPFFKTSRDAELAEPSAFPLRSALAILAVFVLSLALVVLDWRFQTRQAEEALAQQAALLGEDVAQRIRRDVRELSAALRAMALAPKLEQGTEVLQRRNNQADVLIPIDALVMFEDTGAAPRVRARVVLDSALLPMGLNAELGNLARDAAWQAVRVKRSSLRGPVQEDGHRWLALGLPELQVGNTVMVVGLLRMDDWLRDLARSLGGDFALQIEDARAGARGALIWGSPQEGVTGLKRQKTLYADTSNPWRVVVYVRQSALQSVQTARYWRAGLGIGFSLMLALLLACILSRRRAVALQAAANEQALLACERRLERVLLVSEDGVFEYDVAARRLYCSQQLLDSLGGLRERYTPNAHDVVLSLRRLLRGLLPSHRRRVFSALREVMLSGTPIDEELRVRGVAGQGGRWLRLRLRLDQHDSEPPLLIGTVSDVSTQVEAALMAERYESFLLRVLDVLPVPVAVRDVTHRLVAANGPYCRLMRRDVSRLLGRRMSECMPLSQVARFEALDKMALETNEEQSMSEWLERSGEPSMYLRVTTRACEGPQGMLVLVTAFEDLTLLQKREDQDNRSRSFLQSVFDALPHPVFVKDEDHRYVMTNLAHAKSVGVSAADVIGKTSQDFAGEEVAKSAHLAEAAMFARGSLDVVEHEYNLAAPQGRTRQVIVRKTLALDPDGRKVIIGVNSDITSLREMERELRGALRRFSSLVVDAPMGIAALDMSGRFTQANPALCTMLGYTEHELQALSFRDITPARHAEQDEVQHHRLLEFGRTEVFEKHCVCRDGHEIPVQVSAVLVDDAGQQSQHPGMWLLVQDLSERKAAMDALKASEARWQFALEGSGDGVWDWQVLDGTVSVSPRWIKMLGYREDEIGDRMDAWLELLHPEDKHVPIDAAMAHLRGLTPLYVSEHRLRCADGSYRWILDRGKVMERDEHGMARRVIGTHTDVTERKAVEQELRHSRDLLAAISRLQARYIHSPESSVAFAELLDAVLQFTGSEYGCVGELIVDGAAQSIKVHAVADSAWGQSERRANELRALVRLSVDDASLPISRLAKTPALLIENAPGSPYSFGGIPGEHAALHSFMGIPVMQGDQLLGVVALANRPGGYDPAMARKIDALVATYGKMIHALRNERLRQQAEQSLVQHSDRLKDLVQEQTSGLLRAKEAAERASAAKSLFLANMSHELRTPMHGVLSFARLGETGGERLTPEKIHEYFSRIRSSGDRLMGLLNDLLDLSKLESGAAELDLREQHLPSVINETLHEYEAWISSKNLRVTLDMDMLRGDGRVLADAARIGQVCRNLLSNAIKFSPEGAVIQIRLCNSTLPVGRRAEDAGDAPAIEMAVADEGVGIPPDELDTIFDKFVQSSKTRTGAGGTGLGLAICREIVLAHRGLIFARNREGAGAEFVVRLVAIGAPRQKFVSKERG